MTTPQVRQSKRVTLTLQTVKGSGEAGSATCGDGTPVLMHWRDEYCPGKMICDYTYIIGTDGCDICS